jgi:hypothetical protein
MDTTKIGLGIFVFLFSLTFVLTNVPYIENQITASFYLPDIEPIEPIIRQFCTDSDDGINTLVKGTTTNEINSLTDYCLDSNRVREYYCDGNERKYVDRLCADGFECNDGRCVEIVYKFCEGTSSIDIYTRALIRDEKGRYQDYCVSSSSVKKYYCDGNSMKEVTRNCPTGYGCENGVCIRKVLCNGPTSVDIYTKKVTYYEDGSYSDYCISDSSVIKYYCDGNLMREVTRNCPSGYVCSDGSCVVERTCAGPLSPDIYNKKTTVSGNDRKTDYCYNEDMVRKYYCYQNGIVDEVISCPSGYICNQGECVEINKVRCRDSDGGKDIYNYGVTTKGEFQRYEDVCVTSTSVREYYCGTNNQVYSEIIKCPSGYVCSDGECIGVRSREYCYNYDQGYVETQDGTYHNYCVNRGMVREYYCSSNKMYFRDVYCPNNYVCSIGECILIGTEQTGIKEDSNISPPPLEELDSEEKTENFRIYIKKGWNLFSVVSFNEHFYTMKENDCINLGTDIIWGYNANTKDYEVTHGNLKLYNAYWFYSNKNCDFDFEVLVGGNKPKIYLQTGWNLFGVTKTTLVNELKDCEITMGPYKFDTASRKYIRVRQLIPGEGYIMKINNLCEIK